TAIRSSETWPHCASSQPRSRGASGSSAPPWLAARASSSRYPQSNTGQAGSAVLPVRGVVERGGPPTPPPGEGRAMIVGWRQMNAPFDDVQVLGLLVQVLGALMIGLLCLMLNRVQFCSALSAWTRGWLSLGGALCALFTEQAWPASAPITLALYVF